MDIQRKGVGKRKAIVRSIIAVVVLALVGGAWKLTRNLKPAAPGVDLSTLWPDTVKRGPMLREVRRFREPGAGRHHADHRDHRFHCEAHSAVKPGTPVKADTVIMIMTSPELETDLMAADFNLKAAEADGDYKNLEVTLKKTVLDLRAEAAQTTADFNTAKLEADRDAGLAKENLLAVTDSKISQVKADSLSAKLKIDEERISINSAAEQAQLEAQKVKVEQLRAQYGLKKSQVDKLQVRAGFDGMSPVGAAAPDSGGGSARKVPSGTVFGKVAQPGHLKAELKIAETQIKDVLPGQPGRSSTPVWRGGGSTGLINGMVSRIEQSIVNGTVTVDVSLKGPMPPGSRPDLSVDGTIQLEKLDDVVFVGRPVFGQENSTVTLFKLEPDGKYANKVKVTFGRSSVNTIEIKDGLNVGDRVILSDMSNYDQYDRIKLN